jgi:hypothetical protein
MPTTINSSTNQKEVGSVILNLENISKEYNNVLTKYNQARSNYISYLTTKSKPLTVVDINSKYMVLPNNFYGSNTIIQTQTTDISACQAQCSANTSCTGSNFLKGSSCLLMKDVNGELAAYTDSIASVPPEIYYLTTLQQLNQKLLQLNNNLKLQVDNEIPIYTKQKQTRQTQNEVLIKNYTTLTDERNKIELQLKEYDSITEAQTISELEVNKNYAIYKYLIFAFIIIVLILLSLPASVSNQITAQIGGKIHNKYKSG